MILPFSKGIIRLLNISGQDHHANAWEKFMIGETHGESQPLS
jgi:hypothetical protein